MSLAAGPVGATRDDRPGWAEAVVLAAHRRETSRERPAGRRAGRDLVPARSRCYPVVTSSARVAIDAALRLDGDVANAAAARGHHSNLRL